MTADAASGPPVLLVVASDPTQLAELAADLHRRFGGDYEVLSQRTSSAALDHLAALAAPTRAVALVLATQPLKGMTGVELLLRVRDLHPAAKRALIIGRGGSPAGGSTAPRRGRHAGRWTVHHCSSKRACPGCSRPETCARGR